jgi:capsular polysaccharide biosynthesis protein
MQEQDRLPMLVEMGRAPTYAPPFYSPADQEPEEAKVPLSQYLWILRRYRWRIGGFIAAAVIGTVIISSRLTPIYESTATVDVDRQTPSGVVGQDSARTVLNDAEQYLATQIKLVQSDSVLRPVDQRFKLRELEHQAEATSTIPRAADAPVTLGRLKVTRPPNTYLLLISYRSDDPQLAADAANAIAQSYLEHTYNIRMRSSASLATFMEKQIDELRAKMERSSQALVGFERELNVINPEEKTNILSARLLQLNTEYAAAPLNKIDELTSILIDSGSAVKDQEAPKDASPLESQRSWERQAEENLLARLEKGGLLAPTGPVDEVLNTVVNNLIVSANLNVEAHCRVMLTTPIETFSIGHTIVISRGLIDVLPDEASLAMVIADELSHIALGHRTQTQFAFNNQTMLSDAELLQKFHFQRTPDEMLDAGKKTIDIMKASPYSKTSNAGLFLKEIESRGSALPRLLQANFGNQFANEDAVKRLAAFAASAPALEENKIEQIAALPLGSRVKVNPWNNQIVLVKTRPISLLSAREKMPFEITPFALHLTRIEPATEPESARTSKTPVVP